MRLLMRRVMRISNKVNNKGFTLVELIVTMAILVIVGAAIIAFFSVSLMQYKNNTNETNVQTESRMAWKRLESNILQANKGIWSPNENEIWLFSSDVNKNRTLTRIYYDKASVDESEGESADKVSVIRYQEYNINNVDGVIDNLGDLTKIDESQVFANFVTNFVIQIYDKKGNIVSGGEKAAKVVAESSFKANEKTFSSKNIAAIRNDIVASNDTKIIYQ